jgi:hypothetical protein
MRGPFVALSVIVTLVGIDAPAHGKELARLCVERPEQEGNRNAMPVWITVQSKHNRRQARLDFIGGGFRRCRVVPVGAASVVLRFHNPELVATRYWQTKMPIRVHPGVNLFTLDESKDLGVQMDAPHWEETGWHSMWQLVRRR